jgi:flagellar protein FliO/FliZ
MADLPDRIGRQGLPTWHEFAACKVNASFTPMPHLQDNAALEGAMILSVVQAVFALAVTLGLFGAGVYAMRKFGPAGLLKFTPPAERRLAIVESLNLDPHRRLVVVRFDQTERLILLGEGRLLDAPTSSLKL